MSQLLRANPVLLVWLIIFSVAGLLCLLLGMAMHRSGMSLRPIVWFGGLFLLIGLPQVVALLISAKVTAKRDQPRIAALETLASSTDKTARQSAAQLLFGPDADADLVRDARTVFGESLTSAELAQFAVLPNGDTVLLARFPSYLKAEKAWVAYLRDTGFNQLSGKGDSQRGYVVSRPVGDRAYVVHMKNMMAAWTGKDDAAIRQRMLSGGFKIPSRAPLQSATNPLSAGSPAANSSGPIRGIAIAGGLALYLLVVAAYFLKGSAWASGSQAKQDVTPVSVSELASRLEAINQLDAPFQITRGDRPNEFFATWRFADAKWIDLARARGIRRTFRIKLTLDDSAPIVRATDYSASLDWSAGRGGADLEWKSSSGIVFFQTEQQTVLGLQLDESGKPKPQLSYSYKFDVNELKQPLKSIVTESGWSWRPVAWQGPRALRWLTE